MERNRTRQWSKRGAQLEIAETRRVMVLPVDARSRDAVIAALGRLLLEAATPRSESEVHDDAE